MATAKEFCETLMRAVNEKWGYVWGLNGELYTQAMADKFKKNKRSPPSGNSPQSYWTVRCKKWIGRKCADCSGLIVWALRTLKLITPNKDYGSAALIDLCKKRGKVKNGVPDVDGLILYRPGHIAVQYKGKVLEAKGTDYGVVYGKSSVSNFTDWGYLNFLEYEEAPEASSYKDAICVTQKGGTVNIRKAPNMSASILGKVNTGQKFKAKAAVGSWCEVLVGNVKGYMHKDYIKF